MPDPLPAPNPAHPKPAAGLGALVASLRHAVGNRGVVRNFRSLFRANQPDGFDCPGCAWPEPKDPSRVGEYCENGVKAVTWETTAKRVGPDFFAEHAVGRLRGQTHHWLESQGRLTHLLRYDRPTDRYVPISWDVPITVTPAGVAPASRPAAGAERPPGPAGVPAAPPTRVSG